MGGSGKEGEEAGAQGGSGTDSAGEGERSSPCCAAPSPGKCSPHESRNYWFAGTEVQGLLNGDPGQVSVGTTGFTHGRSPAPPRLIQGPHPHVGEVTFSLCLLSRLASLPSPLTQGVAKPPPPPSSPLPKRKSAPSPSSQCPSAMSGQRLQARSCQRVGLGAGIKTVSFCCQIPNRWAVGTRLGAGGWGERRGRAGIALPVFLGG